MLQFENVQKYYGSFLALQIPFLFLENGLWLLKGENGSGKTTFLKMIAGLHPFTGNIVADRQFSIKKQRQQCIKAISYVEAEPLYPNFLTAKELVQLFCYTRGGDTNEALQLLKQLHIDEAYTQPLGTFSSGMIKKLSLTLAFIGNQKIILLDEPLITIDAEAIGNICSIIRNKQKQGISFIITSHQTIPVDRLEITGMLQADNKTITIAGI